MIVYDNPSPSDNRVRMEANQPFPGQQNDIPALHDGRKRGRRGGRNNVEARALEAQQRVRFEGPQRDNANLRKCSPKTRQVSGTGTRDTSRVASTDKTDPEMIFEKRKLFPYHKPRVDPGKNLTRVP